MDVNKLHVKHDQPELDGASHSVYESRPKEVAAVIEDAGGLPQILRRNTLSIRKQL